MGRSSRLAAALAVAAGILPLLYAWHAPAKGEATGTPYPSEDSYAVIAASFADTGTLAEGGKPTAHREPVYPVLLGVFFKLFGKSYGSELALNAPLNALLVFGLFRTASALFGEKVGLLSAAIAAVYPPFVYYAARPRRETLLALLCVASIATLVWARHRGGLGRFGIAGTVNALAALTNTTVLPFGLFCAPLWLLWLSRGALKKGIALAGVYVAVFLAVYAPWPIRNYRVFHRFVAGAAGAGGTVFYINQLVPAELGGLPEEERLVHADPVYQAARGLDPVEVDRYFWKAGFARVKQAPGRFLRLALKRFFVDEWRVAPRPRPYESSYRTVRLAAWLSDGWIIPLGLFGVFFYWRLAPPESAWILWFVLSYNALYAALFSILRYRIPVMPWIIVFASLAITRIYDQKIKA